MFWYILNCLREVEHVPDIGVDRSVDVDLGLLVELGTIFVYKLINHKLRQVIDFFFMEC